MSFALKRFPTVEYATEEEVIDASYQLDATFLSDPNIEERVNGEVKDVSVAILRERLVEREIARETGDSEDVAIPVRVVEGSEEPVEKDENELVD